VEGGRGGIPPRDGGLGVVVLLAMRAGGRFEEHSTPGPISSVVRGGRIPFAAGGEAWSGAVLTCDAGVRHAVEASGHAVCHNDVARGGRSGGTTP
jgi:quercetin dioxygenase-like cupin family protein